MLGVKDWVKTRRGHIKVTNPETGKCTFLTKNPQGAKSMQDFYLEDDWLDWWWYITENQIVYSFDEEQLQTHHQLRVVEKIDYQHGDRFIFTEVFSEEFTRVLETTKGKLKVFEGDEPGNLMFFDPNKMIE